MNIKNSHFTTIWLSDEDDKCIKIIDQRFLPHDFVIEDLTTVNDVYTAIKDMHVRGAPLIGVAGAFGIYLAVLNADQALPIDEQIDQSAKLLCSARPTAVNLSWATEIVKARVAKQPSYEAKLQEALQTCMQLREDEIDRCRKIGNYGLELIKEVARKKENGIVNILTHCNAGWLACVDYGTATAPIYLAHDLGIKVHVWVDETRPRNQGASLTAWELQQHQVPHTIICDNTGGHLMQNNMVDMVIVGTDRTTRSGNVANKIGTYLKALAAKDNNIPFYVAAPSSSIDWNISEISEIPIEIRNEKEVTHISGKAGNTIVEIQLTPDNSPALNYGFDVTPAHLVSGLITEQGICQADENSICTLFNKN